MTAADPTTALLATLTSARDEAAAATAHAEELAARSARLVAQAMRAGVPATTLAELLDVTRSRVYQLARAGGWTASG